MKAKRISSYGLVEQSGYICSVSEFELETTADDGAELQVVDETSHKVVSYHIAYNGYWNKR